MGQRAACVNNMTAHGSPLGPGPGSPNVFIGRLPAWRGLPATAVADLTQAFTQAVKEAQCALAAPNPDVQAKFLNDLAKTVGKMLLIMASADQHACPVVKVVVPDGNGVVINGSSSVLINGLPASRLGDTIMESTSMSSITGGDSTVLIGG